MAEELHAATETEFLRAALQARKLRTRADDAQHRVASQPRHGREQRPHVLARIEVRHAKKRRLPFREALG